MRLFERNRGERRSVGERLVADEAATPKEQTPQPGTAFQREAPPLAVYLDPDTEHGRKRIILMLSEDGTIIEPLYRLGNISYVEQLSLMMQETGVLVDQMIGFAVQSEEQNRNLMAEVEFLRGQIAKNVAPPPPKVVPQPFGAVHPSVEAGD